MSHGTSHFGKVAVLLGGRSAERAISLESGGAVLQALVRERIEAEGLGPDAERRGRLAAPEVETAPDGRGS